MAFPTTGLVSYWKLDEASGTRVDSHGTNHLTPTNAPVGAAGKIGNGCDFESSSAQYLSHADPTPLGDEDFTYTFWMKSESITTDAQLIAKDTNTGRSYYLVAHPVGTPGSVAMAFNGTFIASQTGVNDTTTWHFVVAWHDAVANTCNIQIDNGSVGSTTTGGAFPANTTTPVRFGARGYPGFEEYFDGLIDEVGLWRRVLTAQERTDLYNGGAGLAYSAGLPYSGDLTTRYVTYLKNLSAAAPGKDLTTLVAKDLPLVRAAHPAPTDVDDLNTLYWQHLV